MRKNSQIFRLRLIILLVSLTLFGVLNSRLGERPFVQADSPQDVVERAWEMADASGVYNFNTQLEQTTYPSPSLANVGSSSQTDRFALDGQIDRVDEIMDLTLYPNSNRSENAGLRMRIDGDTAYGLSPNGTWERMENIGNVFAPSSDPLGYLAAAHNIRFVGHEAFGPGEISPDLTFAKYAFDLDGHAFAQYMVQQMEAQLQAEGKLPEGLSLSGADVYKEMSGQGFIWLNANGLPSRFVAEIIMPPRDGTEKLDFTVETIFSNFDLERIAVAQTTPFSDPLTWVTSTILLPENIQAMQSAGSQLSIALAFAALFFLLLYSLRYRRREFVIGLNFSLVIAMLFTPLLQSEQVSAFHQTVAAESAEHEANVAEQERQIELQESLTESTWNPNQPAVDQLAQPEELAAVETAVDVETAAFSPPLAPAQQTQIDDLDTTDTDGDGLIDLAENVLGTDINNVDSDGDTLTDGTEYNQLGLDPTNVDSDLDSLPDNIEVTGFVFQGEQYYLNPLKADTNNDGLSDAHECPNLSIIADTTGEPCLDTDSDGEPDVFDFDNDNDGVPDKVDLSPNSVLGSETSFFNEANPFTFNIDQLATDEPALVSFQLRPVNPEQVYYSGSIFDWPTVDLAGQVLRYGSSTFASTQNTDIRLDLPNANNGDLHVSPKLEIYVPYDSSTYGSLPKLPSADGSSTAVADWLDMSKLEPYGITVQQADDAGNIYLYLPLNIVEDDTGGNLVGFTGQTLYWPSTDSWGADHEVRLVWVVQAIVNNNPRNPVDTLSVLHIYEDEPWYLTGMSVREDHGFNIALAVEDPAVDPPADEGIFHEDEVLELATSLGVTFVEGVDCTFVNATDTDCTLVTDMMTVDDIVTRFDHATNDTVSDGERWFINDSLAVEQHGYDHIGFMAHVAMTNTKSILNTYFSSDDTPLVLFAREESARNLNLSDATDTLATNQTLDLTMAEGSLKTTTHSLNVAPFKFLDGDWAQYPMEDYLEIFEAGLENHPDFSVSAGADQVEKDIVQGEIIAAQMYLMSFYLGLSGAVAINDQEYLNVESLYAEKALQSGSSFKWSGVAVDIASAFFSYIIWGTRIHDVADNSGIMYKLSSAFGRIKQGEGTNFQLVNIPLSRAGRLTLGVTVAAILALSIWALVSHITNGGHWLDSIFIVLNAASAVVLAIQLINVIANMVRAFQAANQVVFLMTATLRALHNVTASVRSASVVTLVVSVLIVWGVFVYSLLTEDLNKFQTNALVAYSVASTVYVIFLFALAFIPVIGPLLVLFIGLYDAIVFIICKATEDDDRSHSEEQFCKGISGIFTETLAKIFYNVEPLVDISDPYRLDYEIVGPDLFDDTAGFTADNGVTYAVTITNRIGSYKLTGTFQDDIFARKTTLDYQFQTSESDFHSTLDLNQSSWVNVVTEVDTIGGTEFGYLFSASPETRQFSFDFSERGAGLNVTFPPVYLSEGYILPIKECSIIVCWVDDTEDGTNHFNISREMAFDIFPTTLDGFFELAEQDFGYSLAWGLTADPSENGITFPRMKDADNDGLRNKLDGGSDVNDSEWDTDADGLSDFFEFSVGSSPQDVDSDDDGLTDYEEARYGSELDEADTDNDGLSDLLELEGWSIGYLDINGDIQTTWVWSNPYFADADSDGILDYIESIYGLNPNVPDRFDVIENAFDFGGLSIDEEQSPQVYIPFEEAAGPVFKNLAGQQLSAVCDQAVCPTPTFNGRYAAAIDFDGVDNVLTIDALDFVDQSFTISAWVQRNGSGEEYLVSQGTAVTNEGLNIGFNSSNQFTCSFWGNSLTTSSSYTETDWHHWSCAYDASDGTRTIYRDGAQVAQDTSATNYQGSGPLAIGWLAPNNSSTYFTGTIDELVIHDRALTAAEAAKVRDGIYTLNDLYVLPADTLNYSLTTQNNLISRDVNGHFYIQPEEGSPLIVDTTYQPVSVPPLELVTVQGDIDVSATAPMGTYGVDLIAEGVVSTDESNFFIVAPEPDVGIYFEKDQFGDTPGTDTPKNIGTSINTTCPYTEPFGDTEQCPTMDANGFFGRGLTFTNTQQSLRVHANNPNGDLDFIEGDFTIGAWVYPTHDDTASTKHAVLGYHEPDQLWFDFRDQGNATTSFFDKAGTTAASCSGSECPVPAYNFDGNDRVTIPSSSDIDLQTIDNFTIMIDFAITPLAQRGGDSDDWMVLYEQGGATSGIAIIATQHFPLGSFVNFCAFYQSSEQCIQVFVEDEHRDRFILTFDSSANTMSLYQDGVHVQTVPYASIPGDGDGIGVGNINGQLFDFSLTSAPWHGSINRLAFFPRSFTQADVDFYEEYREGEFFPTLYVQQNRFGLAHGYENFGANVSDNNLSGVFSVETNKWNHIAVTYDDTESTLVFYHNGVRVREFTNVVTANSPFLTDLRQLRIGWAGGDYRHFEGSIDSIVFYDQVLSEEEMVSLATRTFNENATFIYELDEVPGSEQFQYGFGDGEFGTCTGDACPSAGRRGIINWAAYFDGNDSIQTASPFSEDIEFFTISAWVKASQGTIFSYRNDEYKRFTLTTSNFNVTDQMPGKGIGFPNVVSEDTWTHIVATYETDVGIVVYINGEYWAQTDFNAFHVDNNGPFVIGNLTDGTDGLIGFVDDLRFYNTTFTAEQALDLYERSAPHVQFRFDEDDQVTAAADASQNGFVGELTDARLGVPGRLGNGLLIDNSISRSYLEIDEALNAAENLDKNFTIMTWVKRDAIRDNSFETLFDWQHGQINLDAMADGTQFVNNDGPFPFQLSEWEHIAFAVDDFNVSRLYLNGELVATGSFYSTSPAAGFSQFLIGIETNRNQRGFINATVDEFVIYERALSSLEIADSYRLDSRWTRTVETFRVTVDTDSPMVTLRSEAGYVLNQNGVLDVATSDPTSQVVVVDVGVQPPTGGGFVWLGAPACEDADEGVAWCPTFDPAAFGNVEGTYNVRFRAADQAGNETISATYDFFVDGTAPTATAVDNNNWNSPTQTSLDSWEISLNGTVTDPEVISNVAGSGVNEDSVQISLLDANGDVAGSGVQFATVTNSDWQIDYQFEGQRPNGLYQIQLRVEDVVGNAAETIIGSVRIDVEAGRFDLYTVGVENENAPAGTTASSAAAATQLGLLPTEVLTSAHTLAGTASDLPFLPGKVLDLHFELNDGTAFADSGIWGNHATCTSCPTLATGVFGQALDFGSGNSLSAPTTDIFNVAPNMTLMAWISPDTVPASGTAQIMAYGNDTAVLQINNGDLVYSMTLDGTVQEVRASGVLTTGTFQHIAGTYDGATLRLYHDGLLVGETDVAGAIDDSVGLIISDSSDSFDGQIDEAAVYNRTLLELEIFKLAQSVRATVASMETGYELLGNGSLAINLPLPQSTQLYLPFNELSTDANGDPTTSFADFSGSSQSATCATATCPTAGNLGFTGSGLTFDGVDDELTITSFVDPGSGAFTAAAWVKADVISTTQTILSQQSGATWLGINSSGNLFTNLGSTSLASSEVITSGAWHHTAVVFDGTTLSLYLDGQVVNNAATSVSASSGDLRLGLSESGINRFAGGIDELLVIGSTVSTAELRQLMVDASPVFSLNFDEVASAGNGDLFDSGFETAVSAQLISNDTADKLAVGQVDANALDLDGFGDYVAVSANPLLDLSHGRYTQMAWVYPEPSGDEAYPVISSLANSSDDEAYPFIEVIEQTKLRVGFGDGTTLNELTTDSVLTTDAWNHIAVSFDGTDLRVYVNGIEVSATADFAGLTPFATQQFDVGRNGDRTFQGRLDAVQIFPRPLHADEILEQAFITGWQTATLATPNANLSTWSQTLPVMEGLYRLHGRSTDAFNNISVPVPLWEGVIDTMAPRATTTYRFIGEGATAETEYTYTITDLHADPNGITGMCIDASPTITTMASAWYRTSLGYTDAASSTTYQVNGVCTVSGHQTVLVTPEFCDTLGNCAVIPAEDTPPVAVDDTAVTDEEVTVVIDGLANDSDLENGGLTVVNVVQPLNGQVSLTDSNFTYTPTLHFFGEDSFTYTISDTIGQIDTATVTITVNNVEDEPEAVDDFFAHRVGALSPNPSIFDNDIEPDGDPITVDSHTQPANGVVSINIDGTVNYTPNDGFFGEDTFTYTISDDNGNSDSATVTMTVYEFGFEFIEPLEGTVLNVGEPISVTIRAVVNTEQFIGLYEVSVTERTDTSETELYSQMGFPNNPGVGELIDSFTWTPTVTGTVELVGYVAALAEFERTELIFVTVVEPENRAPEALDDTVSVDEDSSSNLDVLANDSDLDGDSLTIFSVTEPANGTLVNDGSDVTYTPNADYFGSDSFSYTIIDGNGGSDTAVVNITVNNVPDDPVAGADGASTDENTAVTIDVLANDSDADGDTVSITGVTQPTNGSAANNGSDVTYTPATGFSGVDSFTYDISDGNGGTDTTTVTVNVFNVNDDPVVVSDSATTDEEISVVIDVLANDTDQDGDDLSIESVTQPTNGTTSIILGEIVYTPDDDYFGSDSFSYTVIDGNGGSGTGSVSVTVNNINDEPIANDDTASTTEETAATINVLSNDTDVDGDTLTVTSVTQPDDGVVVNNGANVTYTPDDEFSGTDSFTYVMSDGNGETDFATVTISVSNINDEPIANDYSGVTDEEVAITMPVTSNDFDGDGDILTITNVTQPANGVATTDGENVTYTPNDDFFGSDSFTYTASDGNGGSDTATVTVTVNNVNDEPSAADDTAATNENMVVVIDVLANDGDIDGDTLSVSSLTQPANGEVVNNDANVTYIPNSGFNGVDTFTYTNDDGNGGSATATVTVTVSDINNPPVAIDDAVTTDENTAVTIDVLANDNDIDGDTLTIDSITQPMIGTAVISGTMVVYTPTLDFSGEDSFTYTISDGNGESDTATVTVTVSDVNVDPVAVDDTAATAEDTAVTIDVLANDSDADGDTLTVDSVTDPPNGTAVNNSTDVTYTPDIGFLGDDSFTYTVMDGNGGSATATVTVTVTSGNQNPVAVDDSATTDEDVTITIDVLANDSDPDGDTLTIDSVTDPANGSVVNNGSDVNYTPDAGFFGTDSFDYTISDGNGGTDTATVTVTINEVVGIEADLSVTKTDDADPLDVEQMLTYTIVVSNAGPDLATGVAITDTLPAEVGFESVTTSQGTCVEDDDEVVCDLGDLASSATATITILVMPEEDGDITNLVEVAANEADPDLANNIASETTTVTDAPFCNGVAATIIGTSGDDVLNGTSGDDVIVGLAGNDIINGRGGNDIICGGRGDDDISGGNGQDLLKGGRGADILEGNGGADVLRGGRGDDLLEGNGGQDILYGRRGDDLLLGGNGADELYGGQGNDNLQGGSGADLLEGGKGDDLMLGQSGQDTLLGEKGNDDLRGGSDADNLFGGNGDDALTGNGGNDFCDGGNGTDTGSSCETEVDIP